MDRGGCRNTIQANPSSQPAPPVPPRGLRPSSPPSLSPHSPGDDTQPDVDDDIDSYMMRAFGDTLCCTTVPETAGNEWTRRWSAITRLKGRLYHVPGGAVGRRYVDLLSVEVAHLATGNFPSERLMVFSAVILQRNRMIRNGNDIRRVMEKRMDKWTNDDFDTLVEEAVSCDRTHRTQTRRNDSDHFVAVFTRLMLQGKTRAAMRWLQSDQSESLVLPPSHMTQVKSRDGSLSNMSVLDALKLKHPDPQSPPHSTLLKCDTLPPRLDIEATGAHIHYTASHIQGSAGRMPIIGKTYF